MGSDAQSESRVLVKIKSWVLVGKPAHNDFLEIINFYTKHLKQLPLINFQNTLLNLTDSRAKYLNSEDERLQSWFNSKDIENLVKGCSKMSRHKKKRKST